MIRCKANKQGGFTLIELLITIAVLSILFVYAPNFREVVASYRTGSVTNNVAGDLKRARAEAMRRRLTVVMCASNNGVDCNSPSWNTGWIVFPDADNDQVHDNNANEQPFITKGLGGEFSDFRIWDNIGANMVRYLPSGLVTGLGFGGRLMVCESSDRYEGKDIIINAIGRPRIETRTCP